MLLKNKKALIFGLANERSIAYGIAKELKNAGASLAFSYVGDAIKKRVEPISAELGGDFTFLCDVTSDSDISEAKKIVEKNWGNFDILIHSVGYAPKEALASPYIQTKREDFKLTMDISAYSLVALCNEFAPIMNSGGAVITLTYLGSTKVITNYNVMGVAKAALEASVRYLSADLGARNIRVNAISAGPIKTLAASGISDFKTIFNHVSERSALKRNVNIEDVGRTALYLASDLASGVAGEVLYVDSGYSIMGI